MAKQYQDSEERFIKSLKRLNRSKVWLDKLFDMISDVLVEFSIDEGSVKIAMTASENRGLAFNLGQRYIIYVNHHSDGIGLIMPIGFSEIASDYPSSVIDENYFFDKKGNKVAHWVAFDSNEFFSNYEFLYNLWIEAIRYEYNKTKKSGYHKYHNPFFYKAVMNEEYRAEVFNSIYD